MRRWVLLIAATGLAACDPGGGALSLGQKRAAEAAPAQTVGVFRPSSAFISLKNAPGQSPADIQLTFGLPGDRPVHGDWDGDELDTVGVYREGVFYLRDSNSTGYADRVVPFGQAGDGPLTGDWGDEGPDNVGVYRDGMFYLRQGDGTVNQFAYGILGDVPFTGDWDGNGGDTVAVYRPSNGYVYLRNSNSTGFGDHQFHVGEGVPLAADWFGKGFDTVAMYQPATSTFRLWRAHCSPTPALADGDGECPPPQEVQYGAPYDAPLGGHWAPPL